MFDKRRREKLYRAIAEMPPALDTAINSSEDEDTRRTAMKIRDYLRAVDTEEIPRTELLSGRSLKELLKAAEAVQASLQNLLGGSGGEEFEAVARAFLEQAGRLPALAEPKPEPASMRDAA